MIRRMDLPNEYIIFFHGIITDSACIDAPSHKSNAEDQFNTISSYGRGVYQTLQHVCVGGGGA